MVVFSLGEILVLALLIPVVLRPLFHKSGTIDRIVILALFAFIISALLVAAEGISLTVLAAVVPCAFVFFFNLRSLARCFQNLAVDNFSAAAFVASFLGLLLIAAGGFVIFRHYPFQAVYRINSGELSAVKAEKTGKRGSFAEGFAENGGGWKFFEPNNAEFYVFTATAGGKGAGAAQGSPASDEAADNAQSAGGEAADGENGDSADTAANSADVGADSASGGLAGAGASSADVGADGAGSGAQTAGDEPLGADGDTANSASAAQAAPTKNVVLFLPDVYASVRQNQITINAIAAKGKTVIAADFYAKDNLYADGAAALKPLRALALRARHFFAPESDAAETARFERAKQNELAALLDFARELGFGEGQIACIVADGNAAAAAKRFAEEKRLALPLFALDESIPGYIAGMGNLALFQSAVYRRFQDSPTDGLIQAQIIASRVEKIR